jgi:sec-independent protein translocase protein TatA
MSDIKIAILVLIVLLIFGAKRLPEIGRQLGTGMREFRNGIMGHGESQQPTLAAPQPTPTQQAPVADAPQTAAAPPEPAAAAPASAEPTQQA